MQRACGYCGWRLFGGLCWAIGHPNEHPSVVEILLSTAQYRYVCTCGIFNMNGGRPFNVWENKIKIKKIKKIKLSAQGASAAASGCSVKPKISSLRSIDLQAEYLNVPLFSIHSRGHCYFACWTNLDPIRPSF